LLFVFTGRSLPLARGLSSSISLSLSPSPPLSPCLSRPLLLYFLVSLFTRVRYGSDTSNKGTPPARGARQVECLYLCSTLASAASSGWVSSLGGQALQGLPVSSNPASTAPVTAFLLPRLGAMWCTSVRHDCRAAGRRSHVARSKDGTQDGTQDGTRLASTSPALSSVLLVQPCHAVPSYKQCAAVLVVACKAQDMLHKPFSSVASRVYLALGRMVHM